MIRRYGHCRKKSKKKSKNEKQSRIYFFIICFLIVGALEIAQLFRIQILDHDDYILKAEEQYSVFRKVPAKRGEIFWQDLQDKTVAPLVINKPIYSLYSVPKNISNPDEVVKVLNQLTYGKVLKVELVKLKQKNDPYEVLIKNLSAEDKVLILQTLRENGLDGEVTEGILGFEEEFQRYYPESKLASHLVGFLGFAEDGRTRVGQYGLEEYLNTDLTGKEGKIFGDKDPEGRPIGIGNRSIEPEKDGKTVVLTIDKNIQYQSCQGLKKYVEKYQAEGGVVIIMNPRNGKLYALCSLPDFDPNNYQGEDIAHFIDGAVSVPYEAGSVFKPIAMAAALDTHSLTPYTTYTDTGSVVYGQYVIRNSDGKAHGKRTMIDVLDKSLNTGIVFAMRQAGAEVFKEYVKRFGFGKLTGIELANESPGNIKNFEDKREIYAATAAFGQGIAVTPIQLVTAYAVIARGGTLVKPTVIEKITDWNKDIIFGVKELEQVISQETAETLSAMLVSGTKNGYAKTGAVRGYKIAAKTGTAQIPKSDGKGYSEETNHTFIGFGPVGSGKPVFVMLVKLDKPKGVKFADSSIAPLFRELAEFLLSYLEIPPTE